MENRQGLTKEELKEFIDKTQCESYYCGGYDCQCTNKIIDKVHEFLDQLTEPSKTDITSERIAEVLHECEIPLVFNELNGYETMRMSFGFPIDKLATHLAKHLTTQRGPCVAECLRCKYWASMDARGEGGIMCDVCKTHVKEGTGNIH